MPRSCSGVRSPRGTCTWTVEKPAWRCGVDRAAREALELARVAVRARRGRRRAGRVGLLVVEELVEREVALGDPVALELLLDLAAQLVDAELVDEHLQAGPRAVDAQPVLAVEDAEDGLGDLQVVAVLGLDELVERRGDARHDRRAAADADLEAPHAVALAGEEGDVVDAGDRAVGLGAGEGGLDLARHQLRRGVADEVAHVGADVLRRVEDLVLADAGPRVGRDVADGVAAALAAGQAGVRDLADQLGHVAQRDVVDLEVLARGEVRLVERRVAAR